MIRRLLWWIGWTCNQLTWAAFYFVLPPNENDPDEMATYNRRLKW